MMNSLLKDYPSESKTIDKRTYSLISSLSFDNDYLDKIWLKIPQKFNAVLLNTHSIDIIIKAISLLIKLNIFKVKQIFSLEFQRFTVQGHGLLKPYGYAGDFEIIDKIYTYHTSIKQQYRIWDQYFHNQQAPQAVRNRKTFFKNLVRNKLSPGQPFVLLNVASGPARDLLELYEELPPEGNLRTDCVELDTRAIDYARNLCQPYLEQIHFMHKNVLRYQPGRTYDLIWSAGLFDYFPDKTFVHLLRRFKSWVKPGGEIVIGNFNAAHNPSRDYMEVLGEWFLIHRTAEELRQLALQAGYSAEQITVDREPLNINLFLRIKG